MKITQLVEDTIEKQETALAIYDCALSDIAGMLTAAIGNQDLSEWELRSVIRCAMTVCVSRTDEAIKELGKLND